MRGKQSGVLKLINYHRITPADAGKTLFETFPRVIVQDHPRGCGENKCHSIYNRKKDGSPPRMRGKLGLLFKPLYLRRITPADAGKTALIVVFGALG